MKITLKLSSAEQQLDLISHLCSKRLEEIGIKEALDKLSIIDVQERKQLLEIIKACEDQSLFLVTE